MPVGGVTTNVFFLLLLSPTERFNRLLLVVSIDDLKQCFSLAITILFFDHSSPAFKSSKTNIFCILRNKDLQHFQKYFTNSTNEYSNNILSCISYNHSRFPRHVDLVTNDPFFLHDSLLYPKHLIRRFSNESIQVRFERIRFKRFIPVASRRSRGWEALTRGVGLSPRSPEMTRCPRDSGLPPSIRVYGVPIPTTNPSPGG